MNRIGIKYEVSLWADENLKILDAPKLLWQWWQNSENLLKIIELYTLGEFCDM